MKILKKLGIIPATLLALALTTQVLAADLTMYWEEIPQRDIYKYNKEEAITTPITYENVIAELNAAGILDGNNSIKIEKYQFESPYGGMAERYIAAGNEESVVRVLHPMGNGYLFDIQVPKDGLRGPEVLFYTDDLETAVVVPLTDSGWYDKAGGGMANVGGAYWMREMYNDEGGYNSKGPLLMSLDLNKWYLDSGFDGEAGDTWVELVVLDGKPYLKKNGKHYEPAGPECDEWNEVQGITDATDLLNYVFGGSTTAEWRLDWMRGHSSDLDGINIKIVPLK